MKNATWEHIRMVAGKLETAACMQESEFKHQLIMSLAKEINETISKITGAA